MIDIAGAVAVESIDEASRDQPEPVHAAAGVRGVAAHYGDPMREQRQLDTEVGLVDRSHRGVVAVPGAERISWLHTLTTQHLAELGPWQGTELLVLSPHGHVEQHAMVAEDGDTTWLDTEPGATGGLLTYLEKMRFFSQVDPRDATAEHALLSLVGPKAVEAVALLDVLPLAEPDVVGLPGPKFRSGELPPRPTARYHVRPLPQGGWARRGPLGVDLLVPRPAMDQVSRGCATTGCPRWGCGRTRRCGWPPGRPGSRRHRPPDDPRRGEPDRAGRAPGQGLLPGSGDGRPGAQHGPPTAPAGAAAPRRVATDQLPVAGTPVTLDGRPVGFVGTAVLHHELGQVALAVVKRSVPDDAALRVGDSAAAIDPS